MALREIRKYQRSTSLLIRKLPFARLVRAGMGAGADSWLLQHTTGLRTVVPLCADVCTTLLTRVFLLLCTAGQGDYKQCGAGALPVDG